MEPNNSQWIDKGRIAAHYAVQGLIFTATCGVYHYMITCRDNDMKLKIEEERRALAMEKHRRAWAEAFLSMQHQIDENQKRWWWQRMPIVFNVPPPPL